MTRIVISRDLSMSKNAEARITGNPEMRAKPAWWRWKAVGESGNEPFRLSFNPSLKVDLRVSRVTSDGGLMLVLESDEHQAFGELIEQQLADGPGRTPSPRSARGRSGSEARR
jgi:hypothetical protein